MISASSEIQPTSLPPQTAQILLDAGALQRTLERMAREILEKHPDPTKFSLIGIPSRGVELASRLGRFIGEASGITPFTGAIDISMHRDDIGVRSSLQAVQPTRLPQRLNAGTVILVDDVLQSGRTCRAALDAISSFGRPDRVEYAVLVDRGMRELPIGAGYVGKAVGVAPQERVFVRLQPKDSAEGVWLERVETKRR